MKDNRSDLEFKKISLHIFNLSTNLDDPSLAFTSDWIRAFSKDFESVKVYSTKVGRTESIPNVSYLETGGGTMMNRTRAVIKIYKSLIQIFTNRKTSLVFHHMSTKTCIIAGPALRLMGVPQGLWYSHSKKGIELTIASKIVDRIFSSTQSALPIKSKKAIFVGHGIEASKFQTGQSDRRKNQILSLGRIARVKNNEALIRAVAESACGIKDVYLAGPLSNETSYINELKDYGTSLGVHVHYIPPVSYEEIPLLLDQFSACYTGSPNSVDKSVIEGAMSGCFTIASQGFVLAQTGMREIFLSQGFNETPELNQQITTVNGLFHDEALRRKLSNLAKSRNNVENTVLKITSELSRV